MKPNVAPEKIYIEITPDGTRYYRDVVKEQRTENSDIEYIRTDAFIEKADKFISSFFHPDDIELRKCLLKKFHEYMKGE